MSANRQSVAAPNRPGNARSHGARPASVLAGRALALLAGSAVATTLAAALALAAQSVGHGPLQLDTLVESGVAAVGVLVCAWLAGSALLGACCLLVRAGGTSWRAGERAVHRFAPAVVRRAVAVVVTAGVGVGLATGAQAAAPPAAPGTDSVASASSAVRAGDLGWAVTADEAPAETTAVGPTSAAATSSVAPAPAVVVPAATAVMRPAPATAVVQPGDSLWRIAARHLPADATPAQVAAAWPAWFQANRVAIGADPDLIQPGQVLVVPDGGAL